jgi:hypothetical protein
MTDAHLSPFTTLLFLLVSTLPLPMNNNTPQNHTPAIEILGGTIEVTGHLDGRSLISGLWRNFFASSLVQDGDYFMGRSRALLQRHLNLIPFQEQNTIRDSYDMLVSGVDIAQSISKV